MSANVTSNDMAEIEANSSNYTDVLDINSPTGAPTPGEFANQAFADGVQARRVEAGYTGHSAQLDNPNADVIGGWDSFDPDDIENMELLGDVSDVTGRTEDAMRQASLASNPERAADTAYVTDYSHNLNDPNAPHKGNARSQMACYSALDAMGVEAPRHAFDQTTKDVYVESVQRPGYDAEIADSDDLPSEYANRVDADQLTDTMAANLIVGNADVTGDNLMVGEDGRVHTFDYDYTETFGSLARVQAQRGSWIEDGIDSINQARDEDLNISTDDVLDRAEELATQLDESGMVDRVTEAAGQYDDFFDNEPDTRYGGFGLDNPERISDRIDKHVTNWSNASDEVVL